MASITLGSDVELDDPRLKAVATRVLDTVRLAGEKAVANTVDAKRYPLAKDPSSYERMLRERYDGRPDAVRVAARAKVMASLKASAAHRQKAFGPLADLSLQTATPVEQLAASVDGLPRLTLSSSAAAPAAAAAAASNRTLALRLRRVVCVDETNGLFGSEAGSDEIVLGATSVDETGDTHTVKKFDVGDFDDGDVKRYATPRQVTWFNVREGTKYPKSYWVTLVLAEEDMGGTAAFLNKLADKLEAEIREALIKLGAAKGGPIGAAIGAVLGWVVGKIFDWFAEVWGDEIFKPRTVHVTLSGPADAFGGKLESPEGILKFKGHGGEYRLAYDWTIGR